MSCWGPFPLFAALVIAVVVFGTGGRRRRRTQPRTWPTCSAPVMMWEAQEAECAALVSLFSVLIVPCTSIAFVLLYGDAKAQEIRAEPAAKLESAEAL